jgi:Xaa-Pro aminopeptidase
MGLDLKERDRRYALIRKKMDEKDLDALIVISDAQHNQKGFARYLSNYNNPIYGILIIFPRMGEPKLLAPSPLQEYWSKRLSWIKDIESSPSFQKGLVANLRAMGLSGGRLGIVNSKIMPAEIYLDLIQHCRDATVLDAWELLEEVRMVKSDAEIELVRNSARLAELSFETAVRILKPGMTEREFIANVDRELIANGAESIFHLFSSGTDSAFPYLPTGRKMAEGDAVIMNTELSGPGGYWVQMVRTYFIGNGKEGLKRMYDILLTIRTQAMEEIQPDRKASEIAEALRKTIIDAGFDIGVNFGHALGLDVVERPLISLNDDTVLSPGMVITIHPHLVSRAEGVGVWLGDTYLLSHKGVELLTPLEPTSM